MPTYTAVMNTASAPNTTARLSTTSMSYSRYFRIAMPHAIGTNASSRPMTASVHEPFP